ncbi:MAG: ABC transporter ATP-binding protein [Myxococcota bacterium]|nr:ABC transporter ATP-binding protein [Myxococcota bacterium]
MKSSRLQVRGLRVDYEDTTAVKDVDLAVDAGMVFGLIGPNGAGKTSLIRSIAALVDPTYGQISIDGIDLFTDSSAALQRIGYMPDAPPLYEDLTVYEFLELFAGAYGVPVPRRRGRILELVEQVQLTEKLDTLCGGLSRGMRQRIFLAKCLLHDPSLLLLDEPASGLDPNARREFGDIIRKLGESGKAIVVSSHILGELSDFCNSVAIMEQGHMRISGRIEDIIPAVSDSRHIRLRTVENQTEIVQKVLQEFPQITHTNMVDNTVEFRLEGDDQTQAECLGQLVGRGVRILEFAEVQLDLHDIFQQVTDGGLA